MNRENSTPWQVDYIFASHDLQSRLKSCDLIDQADIWSNSDHCVVVATFELPEQV